MAETFLQLKPQERSEIYRALAPPLGRAPVVLEKDVWVCWVLQALFTRAGRLPMAFKGGTSLSKVYRAIDRFSEDVDITLDYRGLDNTVDPFAAGLSKTKLKQFSEGLKSFVRDHVHHVLVPFLETRLRADCGSGGARIEASDDGECVRVHYPSALGNAAGGYISDNVLIEFGGRNITEPNESHFIQPDIAAQLPDLAFPGARVSVLSPARTFWEKATLMHVACQRGEFGTQAERLSRHWYDLARLAALPHGNTALADRHLLADVVRHKKVFYSTGYARYDDCLVGQLRLIPDGAALVALQADFQHMVDAGMFIGEPPSFGAIVDRLRALETQINAPMAPISPDALSPTIPRPRSD